MYILKIMQDKTIKNDNELSKTTSGTDKTYKFQH